MKKALFLILSLVTFFSPSKGESTSIIFQISLAEKWFKLVQKYDVKQKQEFVLGTLIRNINYLEDLNFIPEPEEKVELLDILGEENPFNAGMLFYSYIVQKKDRHVERWGVYRHLVGISKEQMPSFLKLLEDELTFDPKLCSQSSSYLSAITVGEIMTGIAIEKLAVWHGVLYKYLSTKPSLGITNLKDEKGIKFPITKEGVDVWKAALVFLSSSEDIKLYLEELVNEFDTAFELFRLKHLNE